MLAPETRSLLTDALRPPEGYRVDIAVGTTYSLNLNALLLAPLSFALHDAKGDELDAVDPIRLLESVRRYADRTTVFCQAGAIHVPPSYRRILAFAEGSVHQVVPGPEKRIFHPKIWALRFVDQHGNYQHRFLCLSRNLTFDRSWDTLLRLDESTDGTAGPDARPMADFLSALPGLAVEALDTGRAKDISSLAATIAGARFAPPAGVHNLQFLPLGLPPTPQWPFPKAARRVLAISAFLDASTVKRFAAMSDNVTILSREASFDGLTSIPDNSQLYTLARSAETDDAEERPSTFAHEGQPPPDGLHAKTFILDLNDRALIVTGSANATSAGFGANVEFDVVMEGSPELCGAGASWDGTSKDAPGLSKLCEPYTPVPTDAKQQAQAQLDRDIEHFHAQLAAEPLIAKVAQTDAGHFSLALAPVQVPDFGETSLRPLSLPHDGFARPLLGEPTWEMALTNVTPYLVVTTTAQRDGVTATRQAVLKAVLEGDPPERTTRVLEDILKNPRDVLRYLIFLLGDPSYDDWFGAGEGAMDWDRLGIDTGTRADLALFEPMIRAVARGDDSLDRIASLLNELRALPNADALLPDGLEDIWAAVWEARTGAKP